MPGRILTMQRQVRELGRLRAGWTDYSGAKPKPVKSKTWVVTSHSQEYIDAAAEAWGGNAERWKPLGNGAEQWRVITEAGAIEALLPPGDPVSQAYEQWSRGGCQRRCDGVTESLANKPCICLAQFGDEFYLQPPEKACRPHTRLGLIVPELPDLGLWRMETHGFYAANEVTAMVDLIKSRVDPALVVPVTLAIEPRTRVAQGKTKQFIVVTVGLRGTTARQILAGDVPAMSVEAGPQRAAIASAPAADVEPERTKLTSAKVVTLSSLVKNVEQLQQLWRDASADGALDAAAKTALNDRAEQLKNPTTKPAAVASGPTPEPAAAEPAEDAELEPDVETTWMAILSEAGKKGWSSDDLEKRIQVAFKTDSSEIDGWQMQTFLDELKAGRIQ